MATWIASKTFVTGDYLTFGELNGAIGPLSALQWLKDALQRLGITTDSAVQTVDSALDGGRVTAGAQSIPDSAWTRINWNVQLFGAHNGRDVAFLTDVKPDVFHLPSSANWPELGGYWIVGAWAQFAGNATGDRGVRIGHAGLPGFDNNDIRAQSLSPALTSATTENTLSVSGQFGDPSGGVDEIQAGEGFDVEVYQSSGDVLQMTGAALWAWRLGPTYSVT